MYSAVERGTPNTLDYRIFYTKDGVPISPFHDIPLYSDDSQQCESLVVIRSLLVSLLQDLEHDGWNTGFNNRSYI